MNSIQFGRLVNLLSHWGMRCLDIYEMTELNQLVQPQPPSINVPPQAVNELFDAMRANKLIEAIKAYRALTGLPLKESKDQIEAWRGWFPVKVED